MVLGLVITKVVFSWAPKNVKLALGFAILEPVKTNVYGLWLFLLECAFGEGLHSGVINLKLGGGLWGTHIDEVGLQGDSILSIDIGGTYLGLSRWSHDISHDFVNGVDGSFVWWVVCILAQIVVSTGLAMGTADRELIGIWMDSQYHVTCLVADDDHNVSIRQIGRASNRNVP